MTRFFRLISAVLHPMLIPSLAFWIVAATDPIRIAYPMLRWASALVFMGTYLLPSLIIALMWVLGTIESPQLHRPQERRWPFLFGLVCSVLTYGALVYFHVHPMMERFMWATTLLLGVATVVTPHTKISVHGMAMGSLTALVWVQTERSGELWLGLMTAVLLASGVVGVARLFLRAHTPFQWYLGYFTALLVALFILRM